jgi:hypothetical protein
MEGKIAYADHNRFAALVNFKDAETELNNIGILPGDEWSMENKLFILKVMAACSKKLADQKPIAKVIKTSDKSRARRRRTWFILRTGRLGNALDDRLMHKTA